MRRTAVNRPSKNHAFWTGAAIAGLGALVLAASVPAQAAPPDFSGTYQCEPHPTPCRWSGSTPSITQTGNKIAVKNDKGEVADGAVTSDITLDVGGPFNSLGIVRADHSIEWSDGTSWHKK